MPSLRSIVFYAIISTISFVLGSDYGPRMATWLRIILLIIGIITAAAAIAEAINWIVFSMTVRAEHLRRVQNMTPTQEALRIMAALSPIAQVELAMHFNLLGVNYSTMLSERGPSFYLPLRGYRISYEFIDEFMQRSDERYLCPVGTWGEGSNERNWAIALTSWLVERGSATAYKGGNKPATWKWFDNGRVSGYYRAQKVLFGEVDETPPLLEDAET